VAIDGFSLTDGSFTLRRVPLAPAGTGFATQLTVDADLAVLGVTADVEGTIAVGGTHLTASLTLSSPSPYTLGGFSLSGGFRLEIDAAGARVGVTSELTVPGVVTDAVVTGTLDLSGGQAGFLIGELAVDTPSFMPLGGSASSLRLRGSLTIARTVESFGRTSQVVTRLTLSGGTIEWTGVDTFSLPNMTIASDGSFDVTAAADSVTIGTFTLGLPSIDLHVGAAGAGTELRIGSANLAITGIGTATVPAFDVGTTGNFAVDLTLGTLEIGGYDIVRGSSTFRFERAGGIFRLRLTAAGSLGVPGLPGPISLDSFELATNGTVDAEISVDRIGPPALSIRDASIAFTRTATAGPVLTVTGGRLHLPVGESLTFPTLTFDEFGQLARDFARSLTLGPGLAVSSTSLRLVADDGVLALEQTASRTFSMPLGPSLTFSGFRAATDGTFTGSVTGSVQPLGYPLTNASFTISKPAGWVDARLQLDTPITVDFGPASAAVSGWIATNGRFRFTTAVEVPSGNRLNLFDATTLGVSGSASLTLTNTGLTGSFDGEMSIPLLCTVEMSGAIDATGTLTGSFLCNPPGPNNAFTQGVEVKLFSPLPVGNDTIRPSLAPIDDITVFGAAPTPVYFTTSASDDRDDSPTVTCTTAAGSIVVSGSAFAAGETEVSCTAADDAGPPNVSLPRTFTVTVIQLATYQFVVDGRTVASDDGTVELDPGSVVVIDEGGFLAGSPVAGRMHSTPIPLGTATAAADGTVSLTFTMPAVAAGRHHLELTGVAPDGSSRQVVIPLDVRESAPQATPGTTVPPAPNATLPRTGTDLASLTALAAMLIAVGCALRRRQRWSR
jgi:hypothetical protein